MWTGWKRVQGNNFYIWESWKLHPLKWGKCNGHCINSPFGCLPFTSWWMLPSYVGLLPKFFGLYPFPFWLGCSSLVFWGFLKVIFEVSISLILHSSLQLWAMNSHLFQTKKVSQKTPKDWRIWCLGFKSTNMPSILNPNAWPLSTFEWWVSCLLLHVVKELPDFQWIMNFFQWLVVKL